MKLRHVMQTRRLKHAACEKTQRTHKCTHTDAYTQTQQEEEEVAAKEVGYEWALSKQHSEQDVPIRRIAEGRKCV